MRTDKEEMGLVSVIAGLFLRISYSDVIKISSSFSGSDSITVLINPVKNNPVIAIHLIHKITGTIIITDIAGRLVYKQKNKLKPGDNIIEINSFSQPAGVYWISMLSENKFKLTAGVVKQ